MHTREVGPIGMFMPWELINLEISRLRKPNLKNPIYHERIKHIMR